jgi:glycosyltransferase involved in cell wall biosynthesis
MRVLHVIPSLAVGEGGPTRAILEIERALAARGVSCTTVATDVGHRQGSEALGMPDAAGPSERLIFPAVTRFYKVSPAMWRWLSQNVRRFDAVHIHALFNFPPAAAAYWARRSNVPYVVRPLGVLRRYGMEQRRPLLKKLSLGLVERRMLQGAAAVQFTSAAERSDAGELVRDLHGVVLPLGIDVQPVDRMPRRTLSEAPSLLLVSRIDPVKNIEALLRALTSVADEFPHVTLDIAGAGPADYMRELQALASGLGIASRVTWLGHVEGPGKDRLLRDATAFVLPSHSESFGISAVEAMAAGLPTIVSDRVAIAPDIAAAGAGLVVDTSADGIAGGIRRMLAGTAAYDAMSRAAHALALSDFSNDRMGERLEALYRGIIGGAGGPAAC